MWSEILARLAGEAEVSALIAVGAGALMVVVIIGASTRDEKLRDWCLKIRALVWRVRPKPTMGQGHGVSRDWLKRMTRAGTRQRSSRRTCHRSGDD